MLRSPHLITLAAITVTLASSCQGPDPRPFAGRGGRSLDKPPRYGDANRYVEPVAPGPAPMYPGSPSQSLPPDIDPLTVPPGYNTTPPTNYTPGPGIDPGLAVAPPGSVPGGAPTPPPAPGATPPAPAVTDVPIARAVPGRPGYVYSPKDSKKLINVEGLRPGTKAKDPETGEVFRVPY